MAKVEGQIIGFNRNDELMERVKRLCPELTSVFECKDKKTVPWFTGWKGEVENPDTLDFRERYDKGYVGQFICNAGNGKWAVVNLPGMQCQAIDYGGLIDIGDQRLQPDISDDGLRLLMQSGYHQLMVEVLKANGGEWPQGVSRGEENEAARPI